MINRTHAPYMYKLVWRTFRTCKTRIQAYWYSAHLWRVSVVVNGKDNWEFAVAVVTAWCSNNPIIDQNNTKQTLEKQRLRMVRSTLCGHQIFSRHCEWGSFDLSGTYSVGLQGKVLIHTYSQKGLIIYKVVCKYSLRVDLIYVLYLYHLECQVSMCVSGGGVGRTWWRLLHIFGAKHAS